MKAAILSSNYKIEIIEIEKPKIKDNEVLINVKATGICGSDLHAYRGRHAFRKPPVVLGHEVAGVIEEVGKEVKKYRPGDRVTVRPIDSCGKCVPCREGRDNICQNKRVPGIRGWIGTFAEYFVAPQKCLYLLPDTISDVEGSLIEPLAVGVHSVRRAGIKKGDNIAILGVGTIGLMCLVAAKRVDINKLLVSDIVEKNLGIAKELGADVGFNTSHLSFFDLLRESEEFKGTTIDHVIITAAFPSVWVDAVKICKTGGQICVIGMFENPITIDLLNLMLEEKNVCTSTNYLEDDFQNAIKIASEVDLSKLITHKLPINEADKGLKILDKRIDNPIKVVLTNG